MRKVVVIGAGGHGQVVADILLVARRVGSADVPIGFVDDDPRLVGASVVGLPVLGRICQLDSLDFDAAIVGIGDNATRRQLTRLLRERGIPLATASHPSAIISATATLGQGVAVAAGVIVNTGARVEDGTILNTAASIDHHCQIRAYAHIAPGVRLAGGVDVGEGTLLGIGSVVLPGKQIGAWVIVGAGAVVTRDIPDRAVAVGNPARVVRLLAEDVR